MAGGWVKSLQCRSRAWDDVYHQKTKPFGPTVSCRKSVQNLKDVVETIKQNNPKKSQPPSSSERISSRHSWGGRQEAVTNPLAIRPRMRASTGPSRTVDSFFPALSELPEGHHSRNVVEIIFHTSWGPKSFSGRIEMIFKVQNGSRTVARFEEYREVVKAKASIECRGDGEENERCVADGNEVMRFHCMGPASASNDGYVGGAWSFPGGKGSGICTFSGSSGAHESGGGGRGRRAMLICRVIAGRVWKGIGMGIDSWRESGTGRESVSVEEGELLVFDSRAVLPCFVVIYKL